MQNNNREVQFNNLKKVHRRYNTASKSLKNGKQITNACYRTSEKNPIHNKCIQCSVKARNVKLSYKFLFWEQKSDTQKIKISKVKKDTFFTSYGSCYIFCFYLSVLVFVFHSNLVKIYFKLFCTLYVIFESMTKRKNIQVSYFCD